MERNGETTFGDVDMNRGIVPFDYTSASELDLTLPSLNNSLLKSKVEKSIKNAWMAGAILDNFGRLWINSRYLHTIIRTSQPNAAYLIGGLSQYEKFTSGSETYIDGSAVFYLIDKNLQSARGIAREHYIRLSELIYRSIRDSDVARLRRAEFYEHLDRVISQLKQKRISEFQIAYDELTGENLDFSTAEFSHICSVSLYPELSGIIENGLIVNRSTHRHITSNRINDAEELMALCELEGWSRDWYHAHSSMLQLLR